MEDRRHLSRDSQSLWCFVMISIPQQGAHHDSVYMTTVVSQEFLYKIGHELPRLHLGKITRIFFSFIFADTVWNPTTRSWQMTNTKHCRCLRPHDILLRYTLTQLSHNHWLWRSPSDLNLQVWSSLFWRGPVKTRKAAADLCSFICSQR